MSHNENYEIRYVSSILKILYPFLTTEFHSFFSKIKSLPLFSISEEDVNDNNNKANTFAVFDFNKDTLFECNILIKKVYDWIEKNGILIGLDNIFINMENGCLISLNDFKNSLEQRLEDIISRDNQTKNRFLMKRKEME